MLIGVVENRPVDEIAAIEPFLGVRVEADPDGRTAQKAQNAADPVEQFAVDDRVEADAAHVQPHPDDVGKKRVNGGGVDGEDVGCGDVVQNVHDFAVLFEQENAYGRLGILALDPREHGVSMNPAPHFRQENNQYLIDPGCFPRSGPVDAEQRKDAAEKGAENAVNFSLGSDIHGLSIWMG